MSSAGFVWRLLGLALRGWYWLLRGRFTAFAAALRGMLALEVPDTSEQVLDVRSRLISDLAEAGLLRARQALGRGGEGERAWREVVEQLVAEGWDRARVEATLGVREPGG